MTWTEILAPIKNTEYFTNLWKKVKQEYAATKVFPPKNHKKFYSKSQPKVQKLNLIVKKS